MAEMTALEYLKLRARLTGNCTIPCERCQLGTPKNSTLLNCTALENMHPKSAILIIQDWAKGALKKTMLQDLLEKFPDTEMWSENVPVMCPCHMGYEKRPDFCTKIRTAEQCEYCWSRPMEEKR